VDRPIFQDRGVVEGNVDLEVGHMEVAGSEEEQGNERYMLGQVQT
jgi:hypothetical protein